MYAADEKGVSSQIFLSNFQEYRGSSEAKAILPP